MSDLLPSSSDISSSLARKRGAPALALGALLFAAGVPVAADELVVVPDDTSDLGVAVQRVDDGGVVLLRSGTYRPPAGGWNLSGAEKAFTVRAETPGASTLDGGGTGQLLRLRAAGSGRGRPVTFEGLVFANGFSDVEGRAGGVTVDGRDVTFRSCTFRDNRAAAPTTGGGAVRVSDGGRVVAESSSFESNRSPNRGAAIAALESTVEALRSTFVENRTNVGTHSPRAVGGAIWALDSDVTVKRSSFDRNEAGWTGGAIYLFGRWDDTVVGPVARARIEDSVFRDNVARPEPCCLPPGAVTAGAVFAEDQARVEIVRSRLERNVANWGGALGSYRAELDVRDSILRGNRARLDDDFASAGGAVILVSADNDNASTGFGSINRPPASLVLVNSFVQGASDGADATATQGGCLAALGDTNRQLGQGGLSADPDLERNRVPVVLEDSVFVDCRVAADALGNQPAGGAVFAVLGALEVSGTAFLGSRADQGRGGAMLLIESSAAEVTGSVFADSFAAELGGAIHAAGSRLDVEGSTFLRNAVEDATSPLVFEQDGSALFVQPALDRGVDATGVVENNLFEGNPGVVIFEGDNSQGARNLVTYGRNRFVTSAASKVFYNPLAGFDGVSVSELNALEIGRSDGSSTRKSFEPNLVASSVAPFGQLLTAPSTILENGAPAGTIPAVVSWVWEGAAAQLEGVALTEKWGASDVDEPGELALVVDGLTVDRGTVDLRSASDCPRDPCLAADRFSVEVDWRGFDGVGGAATPVPLAVESDDSSVLWFFDPDNWELLVKVLDACAVNGNRWVYAAATTNVEYTLRVTDLVTGAVRTYTNPLGRRSPAITDTGAFACEPGSTWTSAHSAASPHGPRPDRSVRSARKAGSCVDSATTLCLNAGRFAVGVAFEGSGGETGDARVVPAGGTDSGLFWFFDPDNWELLIKVLDACGINDRYWVLSAATTDLGFRLNVTDTSTGRTVEYENQLGVRSPAIVDVQAFPCSP